MGKMIRIADMRDVPELMDIYNEAILNTTATFDTEVKDYQNRVEWFSSHTGAYRIYVKEIEGKVAGYASLSRYRDRKAFDSAVEISIYIHKEYRGQHIGHELMDAILSFAKEQEGIETIISLIESGNEASIHLHEKYGFTYSGQIRNAGIKFGKKLSLNAYQIIYDREN